MANLKHFNNTTGKWEEIKVSTRFKDLLNTVKLTQDQNYVNIGITNYNPNDDVIFVIQNSTWLQKDEDYTINDGLLRIESKDGSNWSNGDTFNFVILKNVDKDAVPTADGSLIQDGSITIAKLASSLQNYINKVGLDELSTVADTLSGAINEISTQLSEIVPNTTLWYLQNISNIRTRAITTVQGFYDIEEVSHGKYRVVMVDGTETWTVVTVGTNIFKISTNGEIAQNKDLTTSDKKLRYIPDHNKVDVTMLGAKGDGITDDSISLKNAIADCQTNGYTLLFSSGYSFGTSTELQITKRINITGYGSEIKAISSINSCPVGLLDILNSLSI